MSEQMREEFERIDLDMYGRTYEKADYTKVIVPLLGEQYANHSVQKRYEMFSNGWKAALSTKSEAQPTEEFCTKCKGETGWSQPNYYGDSELEMVWVDCPRCKGSGVEPAPPSSQALVAAALRMAAGICKRNAERAETLEEDVALVSVAEEILALTSTEASKELEEFGMKVARESDIRSKANRTQTSEELLSIVKQVMEGEK